MTKKSWKEQQLDRAVKEYEKLMDRLEGINYRAHELEQEIRILSDDVKTENAKKDGEQNDKGKNKR